MLHIGSDVVLMHPAPVCVRLSKLAIDKMMLPACTGHS